MRILVTGVAGFIGSNLAQRLLIDGHEVIGVDDYSNGFEKNVPNGVKMIVSDLRNENISSLLPKKVDVIMHLAGQASGENSFSDPVDDLSRNATTTLNLIRYGREASVSRLIFASSMSCYGDIDGERADENTLCRPKSCYAVAKLAAERYLHVFGDDLPFTSFRLFNVYGPGQNLANLRQGMISIFLAQALQGGRVQVKGSLDRFRDFIWIDDVVEAFVLAGTSDNATGQTLNLGTGQATTVNRVLENLKNHIPDLEWFVDGSTPGDQMGLYASTDRLKQTLGFETRTGIVDGIAAFVAWAEEHIQNQE